MQELIRFDEMGEDVYYILEQNNIVLHARLIETRKEGNFSVLNLEKIQAERSLPRHIQCEFIQKQYPSMIGFTESIIVSYLLEAKKSDRYRMILTRCPGEWLEEDEMKEWLH